MAPTLAVLGLLLFKRNIQNGMRLKGPPFHFFRRCETLFFLSSKGPPSILLESPSQYPELSPISELLTLYPNYIVFL